MGAALFLLAKHKDAQNTLREELKRLLPNKHSPVTQDTLNEAQYLKASVKEATRLAPIAVGNARTLTKNLILKGYQIPKGVSVRSSLPPQKHCSFSFKDYDSIEPHVCFYGNRQVL